MILYRHHINKPLHHGTTASLGIQVTCSSSPAASPCSNLVSQAKSKGGLTNSLFIPKTRQLTKHDTFIRIKQIRQKKQVLSHIKSHRMSKRRRCRYPLHLTSLRGTKFRPANRDMDREVVKGCFGNFPRGEEEMKWGHEMDGLSLRLQNGKICSSNIRQGRGWKPMRAGRKRRRLVG
jgi:hypothetical protein